MSKFMIIKTIVATWDKINKLYF